MEDLLQAARDVFTPQILGIILLAAVYGVFFGAVPGLTATMAVALIVPLTYFMGPLPALAAVITLAACAIYAGDIPCALVRIPGTPASAAYTDDLYAVSQIHGPYSGLTRTLIFSVAGGLFGVAAFVLFAPQLAGVAERFASAEYFWFYVLGLGCAAVVSRGSPLKGTVALLLGLLLSTVGLGAGHAEPRFTFDIPELFHGIDLIPAMIGLFGISEILRIVLVMDAEPGKTAGFQPARGFPIAQTLRELWTRKVAWFRSSSIGTVIGMLPGAGADIAAWVSYGVSRRFSRKPQEYGKGSVEGLSDASAANNASLAGAWVPALVFGIPGDSITALVIGILMMKNLRPGPEIFERQGRLVMSLYVVFFLANLILIPVGLAAIKAGGALVRVPRKVLVPVILLFCVIGAFAINGSPFDVGVMAAMGLLGFVLDRFGVPPGPVVLGLVLGGPLEEKIIQTLTKSEGSLWAFVDRPVARVLACLTLALWLWPLAARFVRRRPAA